MRFDVSIQTDNAAFSEDGASSDELARILRDVADKVERGARNARIRDVNGNTVGHFNHYED